MLLSMDRHPTLQDAIAKMTRRRGGKHAFARLEPARIALVVIDMVRDFVDENPAARAIVPVIDRLSAVLRAAGGTVAWVVPAPLSEWKSARVLEDLWGVDHVRRLDEAYREGSAANALAPGLTVAAGDIVVAKRAYSAFFPSACDLPAMLRGRGVDTVLIAGTLTNVCCDASARDAMQDGFRVVMVADVNAARNEAEHDAALYNIARCYGDVRYVEDLLPLLAPPP